MAAGSGPLALALEIDGDGAHPAAWRRAAHQPHELLGPRRLRAIATTAERAGFTLVTLDDEITTADGPGEIVGRVGAIERAAFVTAATSVLAVAPTISTTYGEPFHISSQLAALDHIGAGRAAWVVAASAGAGVAAAWGRPHVDDAGGLRREAADAVEVVRRLWDSWEDDAAIRHVASSRYLDRDRLHYIDFTGETYAVKGPAIVPRPPQGQVVVLASPDLVPSELIDVALLRGRTVAELRNALAAATPPKRFAEIEVALDSPDLTAAERLARLDAHRPWADTERLRYIGNSAGLVALIIDLVGVADGVRLVPSSLDDDLPELSRLVLPELIDRRVAARPLPGATLRTNLGLPRPENRYATTAGAPR
jgi:alkanesulfonate monooxygenase SsuD/methylene tetrahydromethanopterin reductase-like flavin-dependent oxidoreductase (luciferase family)